ncbi:uncharacterized protein ACBT44_004584 isoform 2-T3 [Syngnathus typhle]
MATKMIRAKVVAIRSALRAKTWVCASDGTLSMHGQHNNVTVALCDGEKAYKIVLFEHLAALVTEGSSYIFLNFGVDQRGQGLLTKPASKIFSAAEVRTSPQLEEEARALVYPKSVASSPQEVVNKLPEEMVSLEGIITDMRPIRMVRQRGNRLAPFRHLTLKKDEATVKIGLWREANLVELKVGGSFVFTHLSAQATESGVMLHSTTYTDVKVSKWLHSSGIEKVLAYCLLFPFPRSTYCPIAQLQRSARRAADRATAPRWSHYCDRAVAEI